MKRILVTGAFGQIGSDLVLALQEKYGRDNVVAVGHKKTPKNFDGILEKFDVVNKDICESIIKKHCISGIYHLVSLLTTDSQNNPYLAWRVNVDGLKNILDLAVKYRCQVFWPSSIVVFGPTTPRENTPQHTVLEPKTMSGVTKISGELLCQFYFDKFGLDVRSVRYPRIVSWKTPPSKSASDYAITVFYEGLRKGAYISPVKPDMITPLIYIDDAIDAALKIMGADASRITIRTSYNIGSLFCSAEELFNEIKKHLPGLKIIYEPDNDREKSLGLRPLSIDDSRARNDWGWNAKYNLPKLVQAMIENLKKKLKIN